MFRKLLIFSFLFSFFSMALANEKHELSFDNGVKYFKKKDYKSALIHFKKAHSLGMKNNVLTFNIATTYYRLGSYKFAETNFKNLTEIKNFMQIAFYNLGLIAEKKKNKNEAVSWFKKSVSNNENTDVTQLANNKLDKLLKRKRKKSTANKVTTVVSLAYGSDDNVTSAASNSPSNRSDSYSELFAYIKVPLAKNLNVKGIFYDIAYSKASTEDYNFYTAAIDYQLKTKNWRLIPEIGITKNSLNDTDYQDVIDYKLSAKRKFNRNSSLAVRYRYSDIESQNTVYDYLKGNRHQLRADYKNKTGLGKLRLRYQLETNDRQNTATSNHSPTRHTFRARLKHKLSKSWRLSEEVGYRVSSYDSSPTVTREDTRLRLRFVTYIKIDKNWSSGIKYTYTDNESNIASENYTRNNIQAFISWIY